MSYKKGKGRVTLKSYFEAGEIPTESQFEDFIDANLNKIDDQITVNTIETDGKTAKYIGIGSKDPKSPISIANKMGDSNLMGFENANGKEEWRLKINPDEKAGLLIQNNDDPNAGLLIDNSGKVGIGTNAPTQALSVESQGNETNISIKNSKTLGQGALIGTDEQQDLNLRNLEKGAIQLGHKNDPNQMTIKENGNVGLGTLEPVTKFEVNGFITKKQIAFSASGHDHISSGSKAILHYNHTITNEGECWNGTRFTAIVQGAYFFTFSFIRDAYRHGGTYDDIFVHILHNNMGKISAWAGEGDGKRATATCNIVLKLEAGDFIDTEVDSDGGYKRFLPVYSISGFRI